MSAKVHKLPTTTLKVQVATVSKSPVRVTKLQLAMMPKVPDMVPKLFASRPQLQSATTPKSLPTAVEAHPILKLLGAKPIEKPAGYHGTCNTSHL